MTNEVLTLAGQVVMAVGVGDYFKKRSPGQPSSRTSQAVSNRNGASGWVGSASILLQVRVLAIADQYNGMLNFCSTLC